MMNPDKVYGDAYGKTGSLTINGHETAWLPLVHPGLLKGDASEDCEIDAESRTVAGWSALHARWAGASSR